MMKTIKKLLIYILALSLSILVLIGCIFTPLADETYVPSFNSTAFQTYKSQGYGSFDKGVVAPFDFYRFYHPSIQYDNPNIDGHPNLDFSKGYEFWHDNSDQVKINTDSKGNTFATIIGTKEYSGCSSIKFTSSKINTGDSIGLLFKWRNKNHLRAVSASITELHEVKNEATDWKTVTVTGNDGRSPMTIWTVDDEDDEGWNIALIRPADPVKEPTGTVPIVYFSVQFQSTVNVDAFQNTDLDDFQIVKYNESNANVYDLDGNLLYNTNNLPKLEYKDYVFGDEHSDPDPNADTKIDVKDIISGKINLNSALDSLMGRTESSKDDASSAPSSSQSVSSSTSSNSPTPSQSQNEGLSLLIWIIIAVGVLLILGFATVIILKCKKKK